ncbi:MAG: hypothetical protein PHG06_02630 [Parabacteroides sp.]|jgi:hypothetical protein|nr:hypothetical protein [Parabacteroides sp.]
MNVHIVNSCQIFDRKFQYGEKILIDRSNEQESLTEFLSAIYREMKLDYPKFFKMDLLCKAGFLASEALTNRNFDKTTQKADMGLILFNSVSSIDTDEKYQQTIRKEECFPSPALFVYTLPNIVTGELAIRNKILGESMFYVLEKYDLDRIMEIITDTFNDSTLCSALCGWLDVAYEKANVHMFLVERNRLFR